MISGYRHPFEQRGGEGLPNRAATNGSSHGILADNGGMWPLISVLPHMVMPDGAAVHDDERRAALRKALGDWLDVDPADLVHLSARSLGALVGGIEEGKRATTRVKMQKAELARVQESADTDFLTGIWNRRPIEHLLATEWQRAQRHGRDLAVILVDIDALKLINDAKGHPSGDFVIVEVARRLAGVIRIEDAIARIGGDEYMIVCPETNDSSAQEIVRKLVMTIQARPFKTPGGMVRVRVSVGWATSSPETPAWSARALLANADARLYVEKRCQKMLRRLLTQCSPERGSGA